MVLPLDIAELAPSRFRGTLVTIQSICITGGQLVAYALGVPLTVSRCSPALLQPPTD